MRILKFGGSSVANAENIKKVAEIAAGKQYDKCVIVVSALGGVTDALIQTGTTASKGDDNYKQLLANIETRHLETVKNLLPVTSQSSCLSSVKQKFNELEDICEGVFRLGELSSRTLDRIVSYGELLSSTIISHYLNTINITNEWLDSRKLIITNNQFGYAQVNFPVTYKNIQNYIAQSESKKLVVPGFIAANAEGLTTTLGRGGSDYTAAIFAAAIQAEALEIWTDVTGMMTADPRWVSNAKTISSTSYREAMELSHFGAKVIYPPTIQPAMQQLIPIWIKNTFQPQQAGTAIENISAQKSEIITGISSINTISLLSLEGSGMVGIPGFSKRLFETLSSSGINVILITQSSSEHSICVAVNTADANIAKTVVDNHFVHEIASGKVDPLKVEHELSIVALVGDKMKSHPGIAGKMFAALGRNGINIRAIAQGSSERNISAVVAFKDVKKAVNVLHEAFFESSYKQLNLFIIGSGNVGSKLLDQIKQQQEYLLQHLNLQIRITGIGNSRHMLFNDDGIELGKWQQLLKEAPSMKLSAFIETIISKNLRNSVVVDVTANQQVAETYAELLAHSIAIVACNKIAASSAYKNYTKLKQLAKEFNVPYFFETNVGAGLPVIGTLNDLIRSGDSVHKIQAVLSGTLNYVFNNYNATETFATVVKRAQAEGYTEPDPRLDLGGTDVMRKIMILAREAGTGLEMEDVTNHSFLPPACMEGTVENFYSELEKHEAHFKELYLKANVNNSKLKFVAEYVDGKAEVGLKHIPADSDFYHLYGKDNIVLFYTQRYPEQPLVIKGAGAGADVTASGVFADIIRVAQ
ncbi:bifunctional aspartate kinase/homoserine dehydrogenase I [Hydrotalea sp.]|uniref:bifunctional aspartate kinase/homoserine dehydrogenase I n=1 Tax=Hydrotalea sp. TaxID=2881279 RepID=UPI0026252F81|nr:bifunctional aspartate kinase/homoserine dehydrogenase I [Hydrotalea sp.]